MCLAVPGKVKKIEGRKIIVEYPGETGEALGGGIDVKAGDYVLVQMGVVIRKISAEEAKIATEAWSSKKSTN